MTPDALIYLFAIFIGCLIRAVAPFIRKFWSGEVEGWDNYYTITFLITYLVAMISTFIVYDQNPLTFTNGGTIFTKGFVLGLGSLWVVNEVKKWFFPSAPDEEDSDEEG